MTDLRLSLLGPFFVEYDGQPVRRFRTRAAQALLAYLACEPSDPPLRREFLMQLFWPEQPAPSAAVNLRQALYQLRRALPRVAGADGETVPLLLADRTTVMINPAAVFELDVARFQALAQGAPEDRAAAAALYRGSFLSDFFLPESAPYEAWAAARRTALELAALDLLDGLTAAALARGESRAASRWALRQLEIDDLREGAHRQLIHALAQRGERSAALAQYESCRDLLERELGVTPAQETEALAARVRAADPALRQVPAAAEAVAAGPPPRADLSRADLPPPLARDRRRQQILLRKVRSFWIDGVLTHTLGEEPSLLLHGQTDISAVTPGWRDVVAEAWVVERPLLTDAALDELFDLSGGSLLLLGEPGAGKTTALLRLGRILLDRAEDDPLAPIPVVLNLFSWAERQQPLDEWLIAELTVKYHIPAEIGVRWLRDDRLLLLLDGYDRVPGSRRAACGAAINAFRRDFGFVDLVVCSRSGAYQSAGVALDLGLAVALAPLEAEAVGVYLTEQVAETGLWEWLAASPALLALARTPLLLRLLRELNANRPVAAALLSADAEAGGRALIAAYVAHQVAQPAQHAARPVVEQGLSWLARAMIDHNQNEMLLEQLQPSWLASARLRRLFLLLTWLSEGAVLGLILWLLMRQFRLVNPTLPAGPAGSLAARFNLGPAAADLAWLLGLNLLLGVAVALVHMAWRRAHRPAPVGAASRWQRRRLVALVAAAAGALTFLAYLPFGDPWLALFWAAGEALFFLVFQYLNHGDSDRNEVRVVAAVTWSWRRAGQGLLVALLAVVVAEAGEAWYAPYNGVGRTLLAYGCTGLLLGGLRGRRIERTVYPNQGMRLSLRNALLATVGAAPLFGLLTWGLWGAASLRYMVPLFAGGVFWLYGGGNVARHVLVRALLRLERRLPLRLDRLLEAGVSLGFLQRVGGGYIFMHQALQDYFAAQDAHS